jgi:hypothetical protein
MQAGTAIEIQAPVSGVIIEKLEYIGLQGFLKKDTFEIVG